LFDIDELLEAVVDGRDKELLRAVGALVGLHIAAVEFAADLANGGLAALGAVSRALHGGTVAGDDRLQEVEWVVDVTGVGVEVPELLLHFGQDLGRFGALRIEKRLKLQR